MSSEPRPHRSALSPAALLGLVLLLASAPAATADGDAHAPPRWELGAGIATASFPAYRGANRQVTHVVPLPYAVWRSERLRVDREGARGLLFDSERFEINVSLDGAIPVDSDDDGPRAGMDDLDPLIEIGPSLTWMLTRDRRWQFRIPVRAAISINARSTSQQGWKIHPLLRYRSANTVAGWRFGGSVGPIFATRDFHAYYYQVAPEDAIPGERPAFSAAGGYSGSALSANASRRFNDVWFGAFLRYDNLAGAQFVDSPLVETDHAFTGGIAVAWILGESRERVPREQLPVGAR